jgi:hypothetical protein
MQDWQIELVRAAIVMVISFIGGYGTYWLKNRGKERDAERRERERQAEYEEFKKKRRLIGSGEVERMERFEKLTGIIIQTKTHNITEEDIDRYRDLMNMGRKRRRQKALPKEDTKIESRELPQPLDRAAVEAFIYNALSANMPDDSRRRTAVKVLSIIDERGPNKLPVGYDEDGNKVEWVPHEEEDAVDEPYWGNELLRSEDEIADAAEEFYEKVWWNRHQVAMERIEAGERKPYSPAIFEKAMAAAKRIEEKYGADNLGWDTFEWGMINGKLSALRWVRGSEWDFLDT